MKAKTLLIVNNLCVCVCGSQRCPLCHCKHNTEGGDCNACARMHKHTHKHSHMADALPLSICSNINQSHDALVEVKMLSRASDWQPTTGWGHRSHHYKFSPWLQLMQGRTVDLIQSACYCKCIVHDVIRGWVNDGVRVKVRVRRKILRWFSRVEETFERISGFAHKQV